MADLECQPSPAAPQPSRHRGLWRLLVWSLPLLLFVANLLNHGFSQDYLRRQMMGGPLADNRIVWLEPRGDETLELDWAELLRATCQPDSQEELRGCTGRLRGQFMPGENSARAPWFASRWSAAPPT